MPVVGTIISLTPEHGYAIGSALISGIVLFVIGGRVGGLRKELGVPAPYLYADQAVASKDKNAFRFNCAQRGHQNLLESYPFVLTTLAVSAIHFPLVSAGIGAAWTVGALAFSQGYASGDPDRRYKDFLGLGILTRLAPFVGFIVSGISVYKLIFPQA